MPFDGLARSHSQEQEALHLERQRSASINSRHSRTAGAKPGLPPMGATASRPHDIPEDHGSTHSSETLGEEETGTNEEGERDLEEGAPTKERKMEEKIEEEDPFLVTLKGREHLNPHTWSVPYRWAVTAFAGVLVLNATFASSAPSNLIPTILKDYGVSQEVGILTISLFVAGYCVGPVLWGPLSERYGRKLVFIVAFIPYVGFQVGCALSPNIGALLAFRFLGGTFAASPLTNSGGVIADLWDADRRGDALAIFALMPFAGPAIAPIVSGFMQVTGTKLHWIFWVLSSQQVTSHPSAEFLGSTNATRCTVFAGVCLIGIILILPETYVPYILHTEAKRLRKETGDDRYHAPMDKKEAEGIKAVLHRTVLKPFIMIVQEPMLAALTIYLSFVYGVVYLLFEAVPIIFEEQHGLNSGLTGLCFLTLPVGGTIGVLSYVFYFNPQYAKIHHGLGGKQVPPEVRLRPMFFAAPGFAVAFFWVAWTSYPSISIASPLLALVLLGSCILLIFLGVFNYLIDAYLRNAASALAINTVVRSAFGAGFPLFAGQMYKKLGTPGASSLLGGLAILFIPIPLILAKYGKKIRSMSKNAIVLD